MVSNLRRAALLAITLSLWSTDGYAQIRLLFASQSAAGNPNTIFYKRWVDRVNEQADGKVRIEMRDGEAIANFGNIYDRVTADVVQIGWLIHAIGNKFPLADVGALPFLGDSVKGCSVAMWRLYKSGLLDTEYKDLVPLWFGCFPAGYLHYAKPPQAVDNLSGLKFRTPGKIGADTFSLLGGTPVSLAPGEMYESVQRGLVDGLVTSWAAVEAYKLHEVTRYHLEAPFGTVTAAHVMSRKKFESLPKEVQDLLLKNTGEAFTREMADFLDGSAKRGREIAVAASHTIARLTPEQTDSWTKRTSPVVENWVKEKPDGDKALAAYRRFYAEEEKGQGSK